MPQVPLLNRQIEQTLGNTPKLREDAPLEAFGGGLEQSFALKAMKDFASKIKSDADHVAVLEAEKRLNDFETKFLYDLNDGAFVKQGKNAFDLPNSLNEQFQKEYDSISEGLTSVSQQQKFDERSMQRKHYLDKAIRNHVATEIQKYDEETTKSYIDSEKNAAILNYQDPTRIQAAATNIANEVQKQGERHGLPPEMVTLKQQNLISEMHTGVVSRMIDNGDDLRAEDYYNQNKDQFSGEHVPHVEKVLEIGSTRGKSQRFVDGALSQGLSQSEALKQASKEQNPKLRDALEERVMHVYSQRETALRRDQDKRFDNLAVSTLKSGEMPNVSDLQGLRPEQMASLSHLRNENTLRDDGVLYQDLRELAIKPETREEFIKKDLTKPDVYNNLSLGNYQRLRQMQDDLINAKASGKGLRTPELDGMRSDRQIIDDAYTKANGKINKSDKNYIKYIEVMDQVIGDYKQSKGSKTVPNGELIKAADEWLKPQVIEKGMLWDSKSPKFKVLDEIPEERLEAYKAALQKFNKPVTQMNLLKYALKDLEKRNGK